MNSLNTFNFVDKEDSWNSEESDLDNMDEDDIFCDDRYGKEDEEDIEVELYQDESEIFKDRNNAIIDGVPEEAQFNNNEETDDELEDEMNSATFIMNQKSLVDKAPGALQHSFAHRTIPLPHSFHFRFFQFISVFVICSMTAGIPFGLPAMRQILVEAGIYGGECSDNNGHCHNNNNNSHIVNHFAEGAEQTSKRVGCSVQEARLAILQVSGWVTWMIGGWVAVRCVQKLGPRNTGMTGCALILVGSFLLAISVPVNEEFLLPSWMRMYVIPVMIMSLGSSFSFLACLHYVRLFPKRTSLLNSIMFLAHDLSAFIYYIMYEARETMPLRISLFIYSGLMLGQLIFWRFVFSSGKIPTIRFTVTTWHQRPLLVDKSLPEHISSPYFFLALIFTVTVFSKIYFYMSTFQVQLRILLIPTKRQVNPEDFTYRNNDHFDGNDLDKTKKLLLDEKNLNLLKKNYDSLKNNLPSSHFKTLSSFSPVSVPKVSEKSAPQFFSHVPFFAEQPGGTSSNNLRLRQFIYNPMQTEIFLTDLQEMLYLLIPIASLITIFWMRSSMSDRKISTALFFSLVSILLWGYVQ